MGTLIVGAILILIVGLIIRGIVRDKKSGKSSCGGDCSHCRGCHGESGILLKPDAEQQPYVRKQKLTSGRMM